MFIVGIDVAKRNHEVTVITSAGQVVCKGFRISNTCTGYNRMMERLGKLTNLKSQFIFAMESTAHYWLALYTRLKKDGHQVVILNPIQTHTMREMFLRKSKTDAKDSLVIAEVIRFGRYAASDVPQEKLLAPKELCRNRAYLMDMASDLKRKTVAILDRVFPEYETLFDSVFCKTALAVLTKYPTPDKLSRAQLGKLTEVLQKSSNGRFGEWKAREIKELARGSFGVADCEGVYSTLIQLFLEQILDYFLIKLYNLFRYGLLSPFRMVCRDFILPETCKPCLVLSFFQFAKIIVPYRAKRGTTTKTTEKKTDGLRK